MHFINQYMTARDGIRLAVSTWMKDPNEIQHANPVILVTTRYWRAIEFETPNTSGQTYCSFAALLADKNYRLVVADARGSGASYGTRQAEVDHNEVADISDLIDWIAQQAWCNGQIITTGTSYSAITTLYSLLSGSTAFVGGVCRAPDFDMYRHLFAPGGIVNHWFIAAWGKLTAAQDANDVEAVFSGDYFPAPEQGISHIKGVQAVDTDHNLQQLKAAVLEHQSNFNIANAIDSLDYIEQFLTDKNPPVYDRAYQSVIEQHQKPLVIRCGWHDAGTALGALSMFATFSRHPIHVILGPFNHDGSYHVDPFQPGGESPAAEGGMDEGRGWRMEAFNTLLERAASKGQASSPSANRPARLVEYYTLGENRWKTSQQWPLAEARLQRLYFGEHQRLRQDKPPEPNGCDGYQVNLDTTTGKYNRWYAQAAEQPVCFPNRDSEDKRLLVYDSEVLTEELEITGHPLVSLMLSSSTPDGQIFVYLERVDATGAVRLLTEGQLRGIHRKVSSEPPPYAMFGPYHSLQASDAQPFVMGEVTEVSFGLLPLSVRLKKGDRIRVAIAGADKDTFEPIEECEQQVLTIERNRHFFSYIDLPIIPIAGGRHEHP
ncbi:CocE/NonD family hydrolase [SAR92 clade bacterium H246]